MGAALWDPARCSRRAGDSPFQNAEENFNTNHLFGKSLSPHSVPKQLSPCSGRTGHFATSAPADPSSWCLGASGCPLNANWTNSPSRELKRGGFPLLWESCGCCVSVTPKSALRVPVHARLEFQSWCRRRLLRAPWTAGRSNPSVLEEINSECSLRDWC